jgi:hypothetical protein
MPALFAEFALLFGFADLAVFVFLADFALVVLAFADFLAADVFALRAIVAS